jgi:hypothetical protein
MLETRPLSTEALSCVCIRTRVARASLSFTNDMDLSHSNCLEGEGGNWKPPPPLRAITSQASRLDAVLPLSRKS